MLPTGAWVEKHPCLGHPALGPRGGMKRENLQVTVKLLLKMACPTSAHTPPADSATGPAGVDGLERRNPAQRKSSTCEWGATCRSPHSSRDQSLPSLLHTHMCTHTHAHTLLARRAASESPTNRGSRREARDPAHGPASRSLPPRAATTRPRNGAEGVTGYQRLCSELPQKYQLKTPKSLSTENPSCGCVQDASPAGHGQAGPYLRPRRVAVSRPRRSYQDRSRGFRSLFSMLLPNTPI